MLIKRNSMEAQGNTKAGPGKKPRKPKFAPITLSEEAGVVFLHFGNEWIQGAMRIRKPDWIELEYAQHMMACLLFNEEPQNVVQLGLGTGALTKFCYRQFPQTQVTAVELNPSVISVCRSMFRLPPDDDRLAVLEMDAMDFVTDVNNHGKFDALQVDLYDALVQGPVLDTPEFYEACAACLLWRRHADGHRGNAGRRPDRQPVWRPPQLHKEFQGAQARLCRSHVPAALP